MTALENFVSMLDFILDTERKRHITGGILLSASLFFGGLALTVMSLDDTKINDKKEEDYYEQ